VERADNLAPSLSIAPALTSLRPAPSSSTRTAEAAIHRSIPISALRDGQRAVCRCASRSSRLRRRSVPLFGSGRRRARDGSHRDQIASILLFRTALMKPAISLPRDRCICPRAHRHAVVGASIRIRIEMVSLTVEFAGFHDQIHVFAEWLFASSLLAFACPTRGGEREDHAQAAEINIFRPRNDRNARREPP